jgi:hypothetical protein
MKRNPNNLFNNTLPLLKVTRCTEKINAKKAPPYEIKSRFIFG